MSPKFNKEPCVPLEKQTLQGQTVDASIADLLSVINKCGNLETIASCSGTHQDHCGVPGSGYLSFLRKGIGGGKFGMDFDPNNVTPEDIKLYNTIDNAGWYAKLGSTYFHNSVTARTRPIIPEWRVTGKGFKQEKTPLEKELTAKVNEIDRIIDSAPDEIKMRKWYQLTLALAKQYCPASEDIIANMFLYGDDPNQALRRVERWDRTRGDLTEEDQVSDERLNQWAEIKEAIH